MAPAVSWSIEGQTRTTDLGPGNRYIPGWRVSWVTSSQLRGDLFVPDTEYTEDRVAELVAARVAQAVRVQGLTGQV